MAETSVDDAAKTSVLGSKSVPFANNRKKKVVESIIIIITNIIGKTLIEKE